MCTASQGKRSALGSHCAAAHDFDQLTRKPDRLLRLEDVVVERESAESGFDVFTDDLRSLLDVHRAGHGAALRGRPAIIAGPVLLIVCQHHAAYAESQQDLGRIPIDRLTVLQEDLLLALQLVQARREPIADVAMLGEQPKGQGHLRHHHLGHPDLDGVFARLRASGADGVQEPIEQPYGIRDCAFGDPAGNLIRINSCAEPYAAIAATGSRASIRDGVV